MPLDHDTMLRIADTLDRLPPHWRKTSKTRAEIYHALETAASLEPTHMARIMAWEKVRYLAVPVEGVLTPLCKIAEGPASEDPYTTGEPPEFCELMAYLNKAAGMSA